MQNYEECTSPRVEQTQGGNTVFYRGRYLYSRRQPQKQIEKVVTSVVPTERTLFLFTSPILAYGVSHLISLLPSSSFLLFIEADEQLGTLFENAFWNASTSSITEKNIGYLCSKDIREIEKKIEVFTHFNFKRIEVIRGSAGFSLNEDFYIQLLHLLESEMSIFWKNRITLIEMARLYSRNIFKWLRHISTNEERFKTLQKHTVEKPILLLGAGPSLDESIPFIKKNRNDFFLLAVDVALPTLSSIEVEADAVVLLEGQYWIEHAFLMSKYRKIPIFASITSNSHVFNIFQGDIFLYSIEFAQMNFLQNLKKTICHLPSFAPLASVGLLALQLALFIAKKDLAIFHTGLDFSYSQGFSHARSSMHPQHITMQSSRLKGLYGNATFAIASEKVKGKNESLLWSTPTLTSYATIYKREFLHHKNIFDIGKSGLILRERVVEEDAVKDLLKSLKKEENITSVSDYIGRTECPAMQKMQCFLDEEKQKLVSIKNMLTGIDEWNGETFIHKVKSADYLYLHFPDYPALDDFSMTSPSFLKRIRIEVEYFLKILK